jgi:hypothetical protein
LKQGLVAERTLLRRLAERCFGTVSTEPLAVLLDRISDPEQLAEIGEWIIDCESGDALLAQLRTVRGQ